MIVMSDRIWRNIYQHSLIIHYGNEYCIEFSRTKSPCAPRFLEKTYLIEERNNTVNNDHFVRIFLDENISFEWFS